MSSRRTILGVLTIALALAMFAGCTESKEELITQGNLDLWKKQPDPAIQRFQKVLAMDPNSADALRGLANAYGMKEDLAQQESFLLKAYALPSLRTKEKAFFSEELEKLYLEKAKKAEGDDKAYEAALRSALTYNEKSQAAVLLAEFFLARGGRLEKAGKRKEAAAQYGHVRDLPVPSKLSAKADSKRDRVLIALLEEEYGKAFEAKKEALATEGKFNVDKKRWLATVTATMPPDLDPKDPQLDGKGGAIGSQAAYADLLATLAREAGVPVPDPLPNLSPSTWTIDKANWVRKPKEFTVSVSISYDEGLKIMYLLQKIDEGKKRAAKKAAAAKPKPAKPAAGKPAQPAKAGAAKPAPAKPAPAKAPEEPKK